MPTVNSEFVVIVTVFEIDEEDEVVVGLNVTVVEVLDRPALSVLKVSRKLSSG